MQALAPPPPSKSDAMISAFFDESETGDKSVFAVAGVYFDDDGLQRFTDAWRTRTATLEGPYRTAHCATGRGAFGKSPWNKDTCNQFMRDTAALIRDTYKMAMVVTVEPNVVSAIWSKSQTARETFPGPYALAILHCLQLARQWADKIEYAGNIEYWFEDGAVGQGQTQSILSRIVAHEELSTRYMLGAHRFAPKGEAVAFAAADFLGWQRQRHLSEKSEMKWREDFDILRGGKRNPIYSAHLTHSDVGIYGLLSRVYGLTGQLSEGV